MTRWSSETNMFGVDESDDDGKLKKKRNSFHESMDDIKNSMKKICETGCKGVRQVAKRLSITESGESKPAKLATSGTSMTNLSELDSAKTETTGFLKRNASVMDMKGHEPHITRPRDRKRGVLSVEPPPLSETQSLLQVHSFPSHKPPSKRHNSVAVTDPTKRKEIAHNVAVTSAKHQRRGSLKPIRFSWRDQDELEVDEQILRMIGPMPPSPFEHKKVEVRKLKVVGFKGYDKKLHEEYSVVFKDDFQIGSGRFGKVYRGSTLDGSMKLAFKGTLNYSR